VRRRFAVPTRRTRQAVVATQKAAAKPPSRIGPYQAVVGQSFDRSIPDRAVESIVPAGPNREITMKALLVRVNRFLASEDGPTAVEYAVMLALIVVVCLTTIQSLGSNANSTFSSVSDKLTSSS